MRDFCVFSEWPTVLSLNCGSQTCKQVYVWVCFFVVQIITNSQADLHSRRHKITCEVTYLAPDLKKKQKNPQKPNNTQNKQTTPIKTPNKPTPKPNNNKKKPCKFGGLVRSCSFKKSLKCIGKYLLKLWEL